MPLVRIDLEDSIPLEMRRAISRGVHSAVVDALAEVPEEDDFQIMSVHAPGELTFDPSYAGPAPPVRREAVIYIEILIDGPHDREIKRALYENVARELDTVGIRRDDIFMALSTNGPDDWWAGSSTDGS